MTREEQINILEERLQNTLGTEEFLFSIQKALNSEKKESIYMYIARNWDVERDDLDLSE